MDKDDDDDAPIISITMDKDDDDDAPIISSCKDAASSVSSVFHVAPSSSNASNKSHKTSPVWKYFTHFDLAFHPKMKWDRICLVCRDKGIDKSISVGKYYSPVALVNHLRSMHKEQYQEYLLLTQEKSKGVVKCNQQTEITMHFTTGEKAKADFADRFAEWVVADNMPLTCGQSINFKKMVRAANKAIIPPDYRATLDRLHSKKLEAMKALKACVSGEFFSLTADHWTSLANENYGALTIHFIKDFELKAFVLSCVKHENGASAEEMEAQLVSDMNAWELHRDLFIAIVTDSAANMNLVGKQIERWNAKYVRHHYCVDHVLQLTALIAFFW